MMRLRFSNTLWQARAKWKLLASVFKKEWTIEDYPVRVWFQAVTEPARASRLKPVPWAANIINWSAISGSGNTRQEALEELRKSFERYKGSHATLPRPGRRVPIGFAARDRVDRYPELAKDFIQRVLELDWAWISDESSLSDFHSEETDEKLTEKIRSVYGVDVSDVAGGNLADIFERIAKRESQNPHP